MPSDPGYYHETEKQAPTLTQVREKFNQLNSTKMPDGAYPSLYAEGSEKTGIQRTIKYTDQPEYPKTQR